MKPSPASISALIESWPTIGEFASDVGCGYEAARQMRRRERIAPEHWPQVIAASARRGINVSLEWLANTRASAPVSSSRPVADRAAGSVSLAEPAVAEGC